ncbi:uncharacterized protein CXorf38 homolog [Thamnophis elegans]|uniref:uncharacterized protein CXorf38 homolog n=1 Tax=Thamnophis elegans TaxID=35005 RepID=UPI0013789DD2|nr:uncharacterized protein CXorf38 homolog [Thamnophis elegans]
MALAELAARLNCAKYKNWLKDRHSHHLLKAALQHFADEQIHVFHRHSVHLKEIYKNLELVLRKLKYEDHGWQVCEDLKVSCMLLRQQAGNIVFLISETGTNSTGHVCFSSSFRLIGLTGKSILMVLTSDINTLKTFLFHIHVNNIYPKKIREVIKCHNELMHSADMKVSFSCLKEFGNHVQNVLTEFYQEPETQTSCHRIEKAIKPIKNFIEPLMLKMAAVTIFVETRLMFSSVS